MSDVSTLPERFDLDLDSWEPKPEDVKPPFKVKLGGRVITMTDPRDEDWQDLLDLSQPVDFLRVCMSDEDRKHVLSLRGEKKLASRKLNQLMESFMEHYEIDEQIRQAQRQAQLRGMG